MGPGVITSRTLASMMSRLPVMPRLCLSWYLRYRLWRVLNAAAFLPVLRRVDAERHHHLVRAGETLVRAQPGNPADQEGRRVFVLQAGHDLIAAGRELVTGHQPGQLAAQRDVLRLGIVWPGSLPAGDRDVVDRLDFPPFLNMRPPRPGLLQRGGLVLELIVLQRSVLSALAFHGATRYPPQGGLLPSSTGDRAGARARGRPPRPARRRPGPGRPGSRPGPRRSRARGPGRSRGTRPGRACGSGARWRTRSRIRARRSSHPIPGTPGRPGSARRAAHHGARGSCPAPGLSAARRSDNTAIPQASLWAGASRARRAPWSTRQGHAPAGSG